MLDCFSMHAGAASRCCARYGQGTGQIVLDNLGCVGTETSLFSCPGNAVGVHNCAHSEDVGVVCQCKSCQLIKLMKAFLC